MSRQWPLGSEVKRKDLTGGAMLYDASRAGNATASWFDASFWQERGELDGEARGRGTVYFTKSGDKGLVLRHYHRGGLVARVVQDQYLWRGPFETRAFREWQLLYHLHRAGLPVPTPVAARYQRRGFTYTADLITERLMDSVSLGSLLRTRGIPILGWITIGRCIRMFHDLGVCHADLNAHNILLVGEDLVYLIDFDRGRLMKPGMWCDGNLVRLRRSLEKITYRLSPEHFSEADWHGLLDGYRQSNGNARTPGAIGTVPTTQVAMPTIVAPVISEPQTISMSATAPVAAAAVVPAPSAPKPELIATASHTPAPKPAPIATASAMPGLKPPPIAPSSATSVPKPAPIAPPSSATSVPKSEPNAAASASPVPKPESNAAASAPPAPPVNVASPASTGTAAAPAAPAAPAAATSPVAGSSWPIPSPTTQSAS